MADDKDCAELLSSKRMAPFWEQFKRIQERFEKEFRASRDGAVSWAFDALDEVVKIPDTLRRVDDEKNRAAAKKGVDTQRRE